MKTRTERRRDFDHEVRTSLLEDDMDQIEQTFREVKEGNQKIQRVLWGLLSALLVAVILLALNLAVGNIPPPGA